MSRRTHARIQFDALTIEGGLLPAEWLGRVAALDAPAQSPADYGVPKGLHLRDEIGRYWRIAEALWAEFASGRAQPGHDAAGAARAFVRQLLTEVLGFGELAPGGEVEAGGRRFPVTYQALGGRVPIFVGAPGERLDDAVTRHGEGGRRRSAWGGLQEYLNAAEDALWGLTSNGLLIRLGRDNASLTRPAWLEADLERIFTDGLFADFSALWLVLHASRFGRADQPADAAPLEAWRAAGREEGSRARDQLRKGVEAALRELGQGFVAHPQNTALRDALASGALTPGEYFNELLRLVYRMIFLLTVEEREILHAEGADAATRALYREGYGMRRLRDRAVRSTLHDRHGDLWASLLPVFAGLGRAGGEPALGLPGLGGLFAPEQCPTLDACALDNRSLLISVFRLAWLREPGALSRVNWKDMGPEELGSVYESLLELVPRVSTDAREFGFAEGAESAGNTRKLTGSYYTPDALVQQLLDTALEPVVAQRLAAHPENLADALLSISVIDPACGSGHFLLAAARRLAGHLARARAGGTPGAGEYRHALREVVTHCIYGVDRNPLALELARMALWLEAFSPDRALGFLDHHLVCGDALLGLMDLSAVRGGIPDEAFKALTGDDKEVAQILGRLNRAAHKSLRRQVQSEQDALRLGTRTLSEAFAQLDELADDRLENVEAKRRQYQELSAISQSSALAVAADLYVAAYLLPKQRHRDEAFLSEQALHARFPTTGTLAAALDGTLSPAHSMVQHVRKTCREARVLHWPLTFPQISARGGFDAVVGNPPWGADTAATHRWLRQYRLGIGQYDSAFLFVEVALGIVKSAHAIGFVLPDSMLVNEEQLPLRRLLTDDHSLIELIKLGEGVFPGVFRGSVLLTAERGKCEDAHQFRALVVTKEERRTGSLVDLKNLMLARGNRLPQNSIRERPGREFMLHITSGDERLMTKINKRGLDWSSVVERGRGIELNSDGFVVQCPVCHQWDPPPAQKKGKYEDRICSHCGHTYPLEEAAAQARLVTEGALRPKDRAYLDGSDFERYRIKRLRLLDTSKEGIAYKQPALYASPKIIFRQTGVGVTATIDYTHNAYVPQSVYIFRFKPSARYKLEYLMGILNSRVIVYYFLRQTGQVEWQSFPRWTMGRVFEIPIRAIDWDSPHEVELHDRISKLVERLIMEEHGTNSSLDLEIEENVMDLYDFTHEDRERVWETLRGIRGVKAVTDLVPDSVER